MTTQFCTTQQIVDFDPNAVYLCATPDAPDFSNQIDFVSEEIEMILRNTFPRITSEDLEDSSQLKLVCIHGVLAHLYRSAVLHKGSSAQYQADAHQAEFQNLLKMRLDLTNGETVSPLSGRVRRA